MEISDNPYLIRCDFCNETIVLDEGDEKPNSETLVSCTACYFCLSLEQKRKRYFDNVD